MAAIQQSLSSSISSSTSTFLGQNKLRFRYLKSIISNVFFDFLNLGTDYLLETSLSALVMDIIDLC